MNCLHVKLQVVLRTTAIFILFSLLLIDRSVFAQDDDLSEASGLDVAPATTKNDTSSNSSGSMIKYRGYALVDERIRHRIRDDSRQKFGLNSEARLAIDLTPLSLATLFSEGLGYFDEETGKRKGLVEQLGIRVRPIDQVSIVIGKERNRRSPGLIVSPSDFLHSDQNLPGTRETHEGVWLSRLSWQTGTYSIDFIALPFSKKTDNGMYDAESSYGGSVFRLFKRFPFGVDVEIDAGRFDTAIRSGVFVQTILSQTVKVYAEGGQEDRNQRNIRGKGRSRSSLLGLSYEGSSDYTVKMEWMRRDKKWKNFGPLFVDESYVILRGSLIELWNKWTLTDSLIRSLESDRFVNIFRADFLMTDQQTLGSSLIHIKPGLSFDWQATIDWKFSI